MYSVYIVCCGSGIVKYTPPVVYTVQENHKSIVPLDTSNFQCCGDIGGCLFIVVKQRALISLKKFMFQHCGTVGGDTFDILIIVSHYICFCVYLWWFLRKCSCNNECRTSFPSPNWKVFIETIIASMCVMIKLSFI